MCFSSQYISRYLSSHKNILSSLQTIHSQQCFYTTIANQNQNTIKKDEDNNYNEMKVKDLKQLMSLRGLSTRGLTRKEQFIRVLEQDDNKHSARESKKSSANLDKDKSRTNKVDRIALASSSDVAPTYDDKTPLADILAPEFDDKEALKRRVQQLKENDLVTLRDWKNIKDPELKKKYGDKVINALDTVAGKWLFDGSNIDSIIEWFDRKYPLDEPRSEVKLVTTYGAGFPRIGRTGVAEKIRAKLETRLDLHYKLDNIDKQYIFIPYIGTLPGAGKSRMNQDLIDELRNVTRKESDSLLYKHLQQPIKLLITFGNGGTMSKQERDGDISEVMPYRILYNYFVAGLDPKRPRSSNMPIDFTEFIELLWNASETRMNMLTALKVIERCHRRKFKINPNQAILIHVGIDEYQDLGLERLKILTGEIGKIMSSTHKMQQFILSPFFSGTDHTLLFKSIESSRFQPLAIPMELLSHKDVTLLLDEMSIMENYSWLKNWRMWSQFRRCIDDYQGYIRGIEMFLELCDKRRQQQGKMPIDGVWDLFNITKQMLAEKKMGGTIPPLKDVFVDVLLRKRVYREEPFSLQYSYGDLETIGLISLVPTSVRGILQVKMPFIFFSLIAEIGPQEVFQYWSQFRECKWWQEWEEFNCIFAAFFESTLAYDKSRNPDKSYIPTADGGFNVTIAERFRGAYFSNITGKKQITVYRDTRWARSRRQFPLVDDTEIYEVPATDTGTLPEKINFDSPRHVILNAPSSGSCDAFEWKEIIITMQDKKKESKQRKGEPITKELIIKEQSKIEETIKTFCKNKYGMDEKPIITVFLSDKHVNKEVIDWVKTHSENVVLICKQNFREYFGDLFADRAWFAAAQNHIRVNEMTEEELQSFSDIGPATAQRIVNERTTNGPFKEWNDLKSRIQRIPDELKDDAIF